MMVAFGRSQMPSTSEAAKKIKGGMNIFNKEKIAYIFIPPLFFLILFFSGATYPPVDFFVYYGAVEEAERNISIYDKNIYGNYISDDGLPFVYTPFTLVVLKPLIILPPELSWFFWSLISSFSLYKLLKISGIDKFQSRRILFILIYGSSIISQHFVFGQINLILAALCFYDLASSDGRFAPKGFLTGVAAGVKLTPAIFTLYLLINRQYKEFMWSLAGFTASFFIGFIFYPASTVSYFGKEIFGLSGKVDLGTNFATSGNNSISGMLAFFVPNLNPAYKYIILLFILILFFYIAQKLYTVKELGLSVALVGICANIISPVSWIHHWIFLVVSLVILMNFNKFRIFSIVSLSILLVQPTDLGDLLIGSDYFLINLIGFILREYLLILGFVIAFLSFIIERDCNKSLNILNQECEKGLNLRYPINPAIND